MITSKPRIVGTALTPSVSARELQPAKTGILITAGVTSRNYRIAKRTFDLIISGILLILLSPIFLLIYIAIKLDDGGPAIITQSRVGLGEQVFPFYKFRSMVVGANHKLQHREFAQKVIRGEITRGPNSNGGILKPTGDGRVITRVGRILRKTSLDELPQLYNVFIGSMSLVGPRPSMDYEVEAYFDWYQPRLSVLPGITGWAQIHGRSSIPFPDIVRLDLEYIENASFWLDLKILLRTPFIVFSMRDTG